MTARSTAASEFDSIYNPGELRRRAELLLERALRGESPLFSVDLPAMKAIAARLASSYHERPARAGIQDCWQWWQSEEGEALAALADALAGLGASDQAAIGAEISLLATAIESAAELENDAQKIATDLKRLLRDVARPELIAALRRGQREAAIAGSRTLAVDMVQAIAEQPCLDQLELDLGQGRLSADTLLRATCRLVQPVVTGGLMLAGMPLGDAWRHPAARASDRTSGVVPLHAMATRLARALLAPLAQGGTAARIILPVAAGPRLCGVVLSSGILRTRHPAVLRLRHPPSSDIMIEARAVTLALCERLASAIREQGGIAETVDPADAAALLEDELERAGQRDRIVIRIEHGLV